MLKALKRVIRHLRRIALVFLSAHKRDEAKCLRWGIIGTGYMASTWADTLLDSKIGKIGAVISRDRNRAIKFGKKFGCNENFGSLEEMIACVGCNIDIVYVATPVDSHFDIIKKCLNFGMNVLSEKPVTQTPDQWLSLMQIANERGLLLIEGMWMKCLPTFRQAEKWIEDGHVGDITLIRADLQKFAPANVTNGVERKGVLMDYGIYALSFACHFLGGYPDWVQSNGLVDEDGVDSDWVIVSGRNKKTAIINISSNFRGTSKATVIGTKGIIEWADPFNRGVSISLHRLTSSDHLSKIFKYKNFGFEFQLEEVTQTIYDSLLESTILQHKASLDTLRFAEYVRLNARSQRSASGPSSSR